MSRQSEDTAWPSEPTCDECGAPLDSDGDCTGSADCLQKVEAEELRATSAR